MIKIEKLYKIYNKNKNNEFVALDNINLEIKKGEIVILKGVSGSGKSTLLSLISSMQKPTTGDIVVGGEQIAKLPDLHAANFRNKNLGFVFQDFNLIPSLDVVQNISLPLIPQDLSFQQIEEDVNEAMHIANIAHKKDVTVSNLSGGEKQRVAIARALVGKPNVLLFDEPTANLDKDNGFKFLELLKEFKKLNKTVVIATHDSIFEGCESVDRIIKMESGKIIK